VLLLAFDTATPAVTVALYDGAHVLAEVASADARRHGELLTPAIDKVLAGAGVTALDVTAVAVGTGPGPYTGLRAGLVTARVLGSVLGVPVYGACTLDVIASDAAPAAGGQDFIVATDARRKELYWARYSADGLRLTEPAVSTPADIGAGYPVAGVGAVLYPSLLGQRIEPEYPAAATLAQVITQRLAARLPMHPAEPLYLRRPDARVPGPPKRVTPS
jgi:tRNA threonylcarbamoyl adenosine modification protein YeaZ